MSLRIVETDVTAIMVGNEWYSVEDFFVDAYEFMEDDEMGPLSHSTGKAGFSALDTTNRVVMCGPLSSIQALKVRK